MRPQHITAENAMAQQPAHALGQASMRPQHITAENTLNDPNVITSVPGFNEAAAYHCGKRTARKALHWARLSGELRVVAS